MKTLPPALWAGRQWRMSKASRLKGHCNRLIAIFELPVHQRLGDRLVGMSILPWGSKHEGAIIFYRRIRRINFVGPGRHCLRR